MEVESVNTTVPNSWDWLLELEDLLDTSTSASVAPETAFSHLNHFDTASLLGQIAFVLHRINSGRDSPQTGVTINGYWAVEIIDIAGYFMKVKYVAYETQELDELELSPTWTHCSQLKLRREIQDVELIPPKDLPIENGRRILTDRFNRILTEEKQVTKLPSAAGAKRVSTYFNVGDTVEARDIRFVNCYRIGTIDRIVGRRFEIGFYTSTTKVKYDSYFCDPECEYLHPLGWAVEHGAQMLVQGTKTGKSLTVYNSGAPGTHPNIVKGHLFELVNPIQMNQFAVGEVTIVLKDGYFKCKLLSDIEKGDLVRNANGKNEFVYHISSKYIFPCGTVQFSGELLDPPKDAAGAEFDWPSYFAAKKKTAMAFPENWDAKFQGPHPPLFAIGTLLECVDTLTPTYVAPALVVRVMSKYLMKIRFLGWDIEFDQWRPINDKTVYPAGWSKLMGYPLSAPGKQALPMPATPKPRVRGRPKLSNAKLATEEASSSGQLASTTMPMSTEHPTGTPPATKRPLRQAVGGPSNKRPAPDISGRNLRNREAPQALNNKDDCLTPLLEDNGITNRGKHVRETTDATNPTSSKNGNDRANRRKVSVVNEHTDTQVSDPHQLLSVPDDPNPLLADQSINPASSSTQILFPSKPGTSTSSEPSHLTRTTNLNDVTCTGDVVFTEKIVYIAQQVHYRSIGVQVGNSNLYD